MSMRLIERSLSLFVWLFIIATATIAQSENAPVLDTNGHPLVRGKEYYIKPAITDVGGPLTLIDRNNSCPLYVGQENSDVEKGLPVIFTPFAKKDNVVRVNRDFKVVFSAGTLCVQTTEWTLGEKDPRSGRRLIASGGSAGASSVTYFRIGETQSRGVYNIQWCPTDVCPLCKFNCGTAGGLHEDGKILLALDGNVLPVVFERKHNDMLLPLEFVYT